MSLPLTSSELTAAAGVLVVLVAAWRAGARRTRAAAEVASSGARLLSLTGRVVFTAGAIVGVQWLVVTRPHVSGWAVIAALGLPALLAAYTLTRALTVTTHDVPRRRGGGRR